MQKSIHIHNEICTKRNQLNFEWGNIFIFPGNEMMIFNFRFLLSKKKERILIIIIIISFSTITKPITIKKKFGSSSLLEWKEEEEMEKDFFHSDLPYAIHNKQPTTINNKHYTQIMRIKFRNVVVVEFRESRIKNREKY